MKRVSSVLACLGMVAGLLVGVGSTPAKANNIAPFQTVFNSDFVSAGYGGMRGIGTGTLTVAGVSGTVTKALLYWHGPTNSSSSSANAAVMFNANAVTGTQIGFSDNNCWGFTNSQAYRADVTSLVSGNGSYSLANFLKTDADVNGVSLLVFFNDGNAANNRDIVMFDGNDSNINNTFDANGWNTSLPGINYTSGTANLQLHVSDGQSFSDDALTLNAAVLAPAGPLFSGTSVPNGAGGPSNGGLWDINTYNVTSFLSPGPNTLTLTTGVNSDCLSLVVAAFDLPAGAAPTANPCATEPTPVIGTDIIGTAGNDKLLGTSGNDRIFGLGGDDEIVGGAGNDVIYGGDGADKISGGANDDTLCGGNGNDFIAGDSGNDKLYGGANDDDLSGGLGNDDLFGEAGNDRLAGGSGTNTNDGGDGTDTCANPSPPTATFCSP